MAITGFWPVNDRLKKEIDYTENPDKTIDKKYVDSDLYAVFQYISNDDKTDKRTCAYCLKHNFMFYCYLVSFMVRCKLKQGHLQGGYESLVQMPLNEYVVYYSSVFGVERPSRQSSIFFVAASIVF